MNIVDRIKQLCKSRGITVSRLEEDLSFGKNSLYRWKTLNPSADKLQKVADYFNVSTDYLLGRQVDEESDPEIRIIQRAAKDMTPEQRKKAIKLWKVAFDELFGDRENS